jgi:hypothetical protein
MAAGSGDAPPRAMLDGDFAIKLAGDAGRQITSAMPRVATAQYG